MNAFVDSVLSRSLASIEAAIGFFYPNVCQICHLQRSTVKEGYVCTLCRTGRAGIEYLESPFCRKCGMAFEGEITNEFECSNCRGVEFFFEYARAAVLAKGVVLDVIHRYKYNGCLWFEPFLSSLLINAALPLIRPAEWDLIIPVPLHPLKRREREFNQSERLASRLAAALGVRFDPHLLRRVTPTETQTFLSRTERTENVRNAFAMYGKRCLNGERIVLVDDVLTTGATTNSCAKVLKDNGSGQICVWTVARAT